MNAIQIVGRLTADPELRRTQNGKAVTSYTVAVRRPHSKDETDFITVNTWEQGAEYLCQYGFKGAIVSVSGCLIQRKFTDKDGNDRTVHEVRSDSVELCSRRQTEQTAQQPQNPYQQMVQQRQEYNQPPYSQTRYADYEPIMGDDEDLPF